MGKDLDAARQELTELAARLEQGFKRVDEREQQIAVGGIHLEALGLFLIIAGFALQGLGGLLPL